jgi:hypothetical protein
MKFLIEVDESKVSMLLEVLKNLPFVKIKPMSPYKSEILEGLKEAIDDVNLAKEGEIHLKSARDLMDEL